jgi:hypothetical protein
MIKPHLAPCPACARHVRVSETACPFCGSVLAESLRESAAPAPPGVRLTRAALFAFGTGAFAIAPGCSSDSVGTTPATDAGTTVIAPPYGLAPIPDAAGDATEDDGGYDAPDYGDDAAYGAPGMGYDAEPDDASDGAPESGTDGAPDGSASDGAPDGSASDGAPDGSASDGAPD